MHHIRRLLGFAVIPAFSLLAAVVLLPLISSRFGGPGWVALGIGQGIGAIASIIVGLAWPVTGGQQIASLSESSARRRLFRVSVYSRALVLLAVIIPASGITVLLVNEFRGAALLFMVGNLLNGLSAAWYFSGTGSPRMLVLNEGIVRLAAYAVSAVLVSAGMPLWGYGTALVVAGLLMAALNWFAVCGRDAGTFPSELLSALLAIRAHSSGTVSRLAQSTFNFGIVSVYALSGAPNLATLSAADQVQKAIANAAGVWPTAFVSWVGGADRDLARTRGKRVVLATLLVGAAGALLWIFLGPMIVSVLFAGEVSLSLVLLLLIALGVVVPLLARTIELLVMVPGGRERIVFRVQRILSCAGLVLLFPASWLLGPVGALSVAPAVGCLAIGIYGAVLARGGAGGNGEH